MSSKAKGRGKEGLWAVSRENLKEIESGDEATTFRDVFPLIRLSNSKIMVRFFSTTPKLWKDKNTHERGSSCLSASIYCENTFLRTVLWLHLPIGTCKTSTHKTIILTLVLLLAHPSLLGYDDPTHYSSKYKPELLSIASSFRYLIHSSTNTIRLSPGRVAICELAILRACLFWTLRQSPAVFIACRSSPFSGSCWSSNR